jgi:hypothetical protein
MSEWILIKQLVNTQATRATKFAFAFTGSQRKALDFDGLTAKRTNFFMLYHGHSKNAPPPL